LPSRKADLIVRHRRFQQSQEVLFDDVVFYASVGDRVERREGAADAFHAHAQEATDRRRPAPHHVVDKHIAVQ
jgi:hypothetical protein